MSQQINLFNPIFLKQKKFFSALALAQIFGLVLLGAVLLALYATFQAAELKRNAEVVTAQLRIAEAQATRVRAEAVAPVRDKALEETLVKLEAEIKGRQQIVEILQKSDFGNTKGYSAYLVAFARQIPAGLWLTGFDINAGGNEIGLQGRTLKPELVPQYVNQLTHESIMQGKSFATLEMQLPQVLSANVQGKIEAVKQALKAEPAPYIEFDLRSNDVPEKANAAGAKPK